MPSCLGPIQDPDCGAWCCRGNYTSEPEPGQTWTEFCEACGADRERHLELAGDCERDG